MRDCVTWRLAAVAVLLLPAAAQAAVQERKAVGWLGAGDWQLRKADGRAYLVESPYKEGKKAVGDWWDVSNPAIKASDGALLAYDAKGRDPSVSLVKETKEKAARATSTRWAFETVSKIVAPPSKNASKGSGIMEGPSGIRFRAMATEGPYKGWYLAAKDDGKGKKRLTLVRARKDATVFTYIDEYYYADHK
jgi:hypothetical protein